MVLIVGYVKQNIQSLARSNNEYLKERNVNTDSLLLLHSIPPHWIVVTLLSHLKAR